MDEVEGEHQYSIPKRTERRRHFEHCDLWWKINDKKHWLEVKTLRHTSPSNGLKKSDINMIETDLEKMNRLKTPYSFHHLLVVLDDERFDNGKWKKDVYSIYQNAGMKKTEKWDFDLDPSRKVNFFLHTKNVIN